MESIDLRMFANMSCLDMIGYCGERREIKVIDDDKNEIETDTLLLSLNWFGLIVHRNFNDEPYHIDEVIDLSGRGGYPTFIDDKLLCKPINVFIEKLMPKYKDPLFYDKIRQLNYVHQNMLHNYLSIIGQHGVVSARSVDVNRVYNHPLIQEIKVKRRSKKISQEVAVQEFHRIITEESAFDDSVFALLYRTKALDRIQSYQLIVERGKVFDIDNTILPFNVDSSYAEGIINAADSLGDSKGAGFSIISNGQALQDSEWFHMKIHNLTNVVMSIRYGEDCGSTKGMVLKIISESFRNSLYGKYYFKEDGTLELIHKPTIENIKVGSTIKVRSVAWCHHGRSGKPCAVCFGDMASVIPYNIFTKRSAVPGLFFGSVFGEKIGQSILKTKHRIGSATSVKYIVNKIDEDFIRTDNTYIYFQKQFIDNDEPHIILNKEQNAEFADYRAMENVEELNKSDLKELDHIKVVYNVANPMRENDHGTVVSNINTSVGARMAKMTIELIKFLKDTEVENKNGGFQYSLKEWDIGKPAFEIPYVNDDLDAYRRKVENFLSFTVNDKKNERERIPSNLEVTEELHGEQIFEFWKIVYEQNKDANIIIHDLFLWCTMVRNPKALDYSLPAADDTRYFLKYTTCITNRGQGNGLLYGYQNKQFVGSPEVLLYKNRQGGVMEAFMQSITK